MDQPPIIELLDLHTMTVSRWGLGSGISRNSPLGHSRRLALRRSNRHLKSESKP